MEAIISKALGGNATITEQEESVKAINFILTQGKATEGHVTLVQELFARNIVFPVKASSTAASLASREDLVQHTVALVTTLVNGHVRTPGALSKHTVAAPLAAIVLRTLLERLTTERSVTLALTYLDCIHSLWSVIPLDTTVAFLPGTVSQLCKILVTSHDKTVQRKVIQKALEVLTLCVTLTCNDSDNKSALDTLMDDTTTDATAGTPQEIMQRLLFSGTRTAREETPMLKVRKEENALEAVTRNAVWVATARTKLGTTLATLFSSVMRRSNKGTVYGENHPHLALFQHTAASLLASCARFFTDITVTLIEICFLHSDDSRETEPPPSVLAAARSMADNTLVQAMEEKLLAIPQSPHECLALAGWIQWVVQERLHEVCLQISDTYLEDLIFTMIKTVKGIGSSSFTAFSHKNGSVLGCVHILCKYLTMYLPFSALSEVLLSRLKDFDVWTSHHATAWVLKSCLQFSQQNVFVKTPKRLCSALLHVIINITDITEQWYYQEGMDIARNEHCVVLNTLYIECIAQSSEALFSFDDGSIRSIRERDTFLFRAVFCVLEKVASSAPEVSEAATLALNAIARHCYAEDGVSRLLIETFDWTVDAVINRLPFLEEYPGTARLLATVMGILSDNLNPTGASPPLLTLLRHVLTDVTSTLLHLEKRTKIDTGVFDMVSAISALLSKSVRFKQAYLYERELYSHGAGVVVNVVAAMYCLALVDERLGVKKEEEEEKAQGYSGNEAEACSEERLLCSAERELSLQVVGILRNEVSRRHIAQHRILCEALRECVLIYCCYDGTSDKLQANRRTDNPTPIIKNGAVVDLIAEWRLSYRGGTPQGIPIYNGGLHSAILNPIHTIWSPLIAKLLPKGMGHPDEMTKRLTAEHVKHNSSTLIRERLRKWTGLPMVDTGTAVRNVLDVVLALLVYGRDFTEDRVKKEFWPLLRYHIVLSPHIFFEYPGARADYLTSTALFKFHHSCLLFLLVLWPETLKSKVDEYRANPEILKMSHYRPQILRKEFSDIKQVTLRFVDARQPPALRTAAGRLHEQLDTILGSVHDDPEPQPQPQTQPEPEREHERGVNDAWREEKEVEVVEEDCVVSSPPPPPPPPRIEEVEDLEEVADPDGDDPNTAPLSKAVLV